jgi:Protein of unknown function (DUF1592)/Protein of unknown function (DUF1588)/Protein of unknown function (DUF1595)/Protein of unknown function (DUF1587)
MRIVFRQWPLAVTIIILTTLSSCVSHQAPEPSTSPAIARTSQPDGMYRLTEGQYRNTIADIFGPDIIAGGRFEPTSRRPHGLLAPGDYQIAVSPSGMEQYAAIARNIAAQVVDEKHRAVLVGCRAPSPERSNSACASQFYGRVMPLLFRRPLSDVELKQFVSLADGASETTGDFYAGLAMGLEAALISPRFIFQLDVLEPDPAHPGLMRLDGYSKAARLSLFLWNTNPDKELLAAAGRGELQKPAGLTKQVDRLLASPRLRDGIRAFFADMLKLDTLADLTKDSIVYPRFIVEVRNEMSEQLLRTITNIVVDENGDYRDIFTTRQTFMTDALGAIYGVPVPVRVGWFPYEFSADSPRAGILTQVAFLAAFSHPGRSSPTLRGQAIRELCLCQSVPDPPGNVDFTAFEASHAKTVRDRLTEHRSNEVCAGCHKVMDPIGLTLENFDGIGVYRAVEHGETIDPSSTIDGVEVKDAVDLGKAISAMPAATACLVSRLVEYGTRRPPRDKLWLADLNKQFAALKYRVPALLRVMVISDGFYSPSASQSQGKRPNENPGKS